MLNLSSRKTYFPPVEGPAMCQIHEAKGTQHFQGTEQRPKWGNWMSEGNNSRG